MPNLTSNRALRCLLVLAIALALLAVGCMQEVAEEEDEPAPKETEPTQEVQYPIEITDDAGREVTIEQAPEKIISFAPSNTEILFSIGAGDLVVAVDDFTSWPESEVAELPRVGGPENPNYEKITSLEPDVVFSIGGTDEFADQLDELGITTVILQPDNFSEMYENIKRIGRIVDMVDAAEQVVENMRLEVEEIKATVEHLDEEEKPEVFFEVWPDPLMTAGPGTFIDQVITKAGGVNIAGDAEQQWPTFSIEVLVERDPDVLLLQFQETYADLEASDTPAWSEISAVQQDRFYLIDPDIITHPSPRLIEGLQTVAEYLHPDLFE